MNNDFNNGQNNGQNENWERPPIQMPGDNNNNAGVAEAHSAQTLGIVGLVLAILGCNLVGLILGILAVTKSKTAARLAGCDLPEGRTGRICGIASIAISATYIGLLLIPFIIMIIVAIVDSAAESSAAFLL